MCDGVEEFLRKRAKKKERVAQSPQQPTAAPVASATVTQAESSGADETGSVPPKGVSEGESAASGRSGSAHTSTSPRRVATSAKKMKRQATGDKADDDDIGIKRLTRTQVRTVEQAFGLETGGTLNERERRAKGVLKARRAELKAAGNGNIGDEAVDRHQMQLACTTLVKLPKVCGMSGEQYLTEWRKLKKPDFDEEFGSLEDGIGWLVGVMQCKTRAAAIGTSAGGVRQVPARWTRTETMLASCSSPAMSATYLASASA